MIRKTRSTEIAGALLEARRTLLVSHRGPDGDAIGSSVALAGALHTLHRHCDIVNVDGVPTNLSWLPLAEHVRLTPVGMESYDTVVYLDCGTAERTGVDLGDGGATVINIDHHPGNSGYGSLNLLDPGACATAELVHRVIEKFPLPIGYGPAMGIYTGILTDTGSFRFSNTGKKAFEIAAKMVGRGVDPAWVSHMVFDQQPVGRLRLLSRVLDTLTLSPRDKAACVTVTLDMLRQTHTSVEDIDGFVNHPRAIFGVEVGMLLREEAPGRYRLALRSKGRVDVREIARGLGGGGHHNASGATLEGKLDVLKRQIFERVETAFDEQLLRRQAI